MIDDAPRARITDPPPAIMNWPAVMMTGIRPATMKLGEIACVAFVLAQLKRPMGLG